MTDTERFLGESGARIEVRYLEGQTASNGLREVDEIVYGDGTPHIEMIDGGTAYMTLDGVYVLFRAVRRRPGGMVLEITCEPDGATREGGE